jgi:rapamycin-insensitive companion of mTOR
VQDFRAQLLSSAIGLTEKRAVLWALGHIGSNEYGIKLILENDLVQPIVNLAENAEFLSLRGTCIYVIGMFCNTKDGKREVRKHNWIASETRGMSTVCLPKVPKMLFNVSSY